jgi:glycosyltransferase involved in cell wall biosynthesis
VKVAVLIPAYNEEERLRSVLEGIHYVERTNVIVVDDGSMDRTQAVAREAGVVVLHHPQNRGKGAALRTGFEYIRRHGFDAVITIDADGQHDPAYIPQFVSRAEATNADIIIGDRPRTIGTMPTLRSIVNFLTSMVASLLARACIRDTQSGYRLIRTRLLDKIQLTTTRFQTESEILIRASRHGYTINSVPIDTIYRGERSYISPVIDTVRFIRLSIRCLLFAL